MANQLCAELLLVQLPEPARHRDASTPQGKVLVEYHETIQQIPGVQKVYWNARVEDPAKGVFAISKCHMPHPVPFRTKLSGRPGD